MSKKLMDSLTKLFERRYGCRRISRDLESRCLLNSDLSKIVTDPTDSRGKSKEEKGVVAVDVASADSCNMRPVILSWSSIQVVAFKEIEGQVLGWKITCGTWKERRDTVFLGVCFRQPRRLLTAARSR